VDTFKLSGSYSTQPLSGSPSADPEVTAPIEELITLKNKAISLYELTADAVQVVGLCGLTNAHVVIVKTVGGKVKLRLTSADGTTQSVPVDSFFCVISQSVPFTALDLTRVSGVTTTVKVFLGERA
jgi:hypothetical protein